MEFNSAQLRRGQLSVDCLELSRKPKQVKISDSRSRNGRLLLSSFEVVVTGVGQLYRLCLAILSGQGHTCGFNPLWKIECESLRRIDVDRDGTMRCRNRAASKPEA